MKVNNELIKSLNLTLPSVPHVSMKILNIIDDPYVNLKKIEEIVLADQALSAKILKVANSAFYGLKRKVVLISDAVNIMGFKTFRDIVLVTSIKEIYKVFGLIEKKLWEHGIGVSFSASIISEFVPLIKKEEASLSGLIHDIGKVILNSNFPSEYVNCINMVHKNYVTFEEVENEIFGFNHMQVGSLLAEKWGFSNELKTVILNHSNMEYIIKSTDIHEKALILGINLADSICTRLGIGYKEPMPQLIRYEEEVLNLLGLNNKHYSEIVNRFIDSFPEYLESFME